MKKIAQKIISIFCELTKSNFELCYESQAISTLFEIVIDFNPEDDEHVFEQVSKCLIDLLDEETSRRVIMKNFNLGKLLSRLFEISPNISDSKKLNYLENNIIQNVPKFFQKILHNTSGLFFLLKNSFYMEYVIGILKQPVNFQIKDKILKMFENWLQVLLSGKLSLFLAILSLYLLVDCKFFETIVELSLISEFEAISQRLLRLFLCLSFETIDQESIPSIDYLFQSIHLFKNSNLFEQEQNYYVSKIEDILRNNSQILFNSINKIDQLLE